MEQERGDVRSANRVSLEANVEECGEFLGRWRREGGERILLAGGMVHDSDGRIKLRPRRLSGCHLNDSAPNTPNISLLPT